MSQVLDEIKYLRVARSTLKGEMVNLIHRLAELEEETLRSELRATIRAERAAGPRNRNSAAPEPITTGPLIHDRPATLEDFETPKKRAEVRVFIHVAKMFSNSNPNQALGLRKMRDLLKHGALWSWNEEVDKEFTLARSMLPTNQPEHTI